MKFNINKNRFVLTVTVIIVIMLVALVFTTVQPNLHYNTINIKTSDYSIHETNTTAVLHPYNSKEFWLQYHNLGSMWKLHSYDVNTGISAAYNISDKIYIGKILLIADDMVYIQWIQYPYPNVSLTFTMNNTISVYSTEGKFQYDLFQPISTTFSSQFLRAFGNDFQISLSDQLAIINGEFYLAVSIVYNYGIIAIYSTSVYYATTLKHNPTFLTTIPNISQNASLFDVKLRQTPNQLDLIVTRETIIPRTTTIEEYSLSSGSIEKTGSNSYNIEIGAINFVDSTIVGWSRARDAENLDNFTMKYRFTDFSSNSKAIVDTGMREQSLILTSNIENLLVFYGTGIDQDFNRTYFISSIDIRSGNLHAENIKLPVSSDFNFLVITSINRVGTNLVVSGETVTQKNIIVVFGKGFSASIVLNGFTPGQQYLLLGSILVLIDLGIELLRGRKLYSDGDLQYPNAADA